MIIPIIDGKSHYLLIIPSGSKTWQGKIPQLNLEVLYNGKIIDFTGGFSRKLCLIAGG
jgi:hypothetical protein